jgi:hypothetical protein
MGKASSLTLMLMKMEIYGKSIAILIFSCSLSYVFNCDLFI